MVKFFTSPEAFRAWLARHATAAPQLVVGYYKKGSGRASMTWQESVDEALCVGWIDGVRSRIDHVSYQIRFTPRKPGSTWSSVNIERVRVLQTEGRMQAAGLAAFAHRIGCKSGTYAYEQPAIAELAPAEAATFRKHRAAWRYFDAQAPSYRKRILWWIVNAKQPATRARRLDKLIAASSDGERL